VRTYLFIGDTHGDLTFAKMAARFAQQHSAECVQLGDWGYVWPDSWPDSPSTKLKALSDELTALGVAMRFIDGNHDDHPSLRMLSYKPVATTIAPNVIYQPRGSVHEDADGTRFLFLGGAPSIDRAMRTKGRSWWPEEVISDDEFDRAMSTVGPIHVLVTHDAPDFPPGFSPKGSPTYRKDQEASMQKIDALIRQHRPILHVHGHWHAHYVRRHESGTRIVGLDCNSAPFNDAVLLWSREAP
jgi:hypothetical protein